MIYEQVCTGKPATVLALAGTLGLANTSFQRHFPEIATQLRQARSKIPAGHDAAEVGRFHQLKHDNDELRHDKHELAQHLDLALANIQRLTLENDQLRRHLEAIAKVAPIRPEKGRSSPARP
jgi:hypothetical protein